MQDVLFDISGMRLQYAGRPQPILEISSLQLPRGQAIALLGRSGAGKTSLLSALGLIASGDGLEAAHFQLSTRANGETVDYLSLWKGPAQALARMRKRHLSFLFQQPRFMPNFTWLENACMPVLMDGRPWEEAAASALALAESLQLTHLPRTQLAGQLSAGEQQRVAILRALMADRPLLLCDEPTASLDPHNAGELMVLIANWLARGEDKSAIFITHSVVQALQFASTIVFLPQATTMERRASLRQFSKRADGSWMEGEHAIAHMQPLLHDLLSLDTP